MLQDSSSTISEFLESESSQPHPAAATWKQQNIERQSQVAIIQLTDVVVVVVAFVVVVVHKKSTHTHTHTHHRAEKEYTGIIFYFII